MTDNQPNRKVIAYGIVALVITVAPILLSIQAGQLAVGWLWSDISSLDEPWRLPFLIGWISAFGLVPLYFRLSRTRVAKWFVYAEAWAETIRYPTETKE